MRHFVQINRSLNVIHLLGRGQVHDLHGWLRFLINNEKISTAALLKCRIRDLVNVSPVLQLIKVDPVFLISWNFRTCRNYRQNSLFFIKSSTADCIRLTLSYMKPCSPAISRQDKDTLSATSETAPGLRRQTSASNGLPLGSSKCSYSTNIILRFK